MITMKVAYLLTNYPFFFIILTISLSSITPIIRSEQYTVGDEEEWNTGVNYVTWSQKYNFTVGDVLDFEYVSGQHNVYEVTEDIYRSCDTSSNSAGVLMTYNSGSDKINLTEAKMYWFICNIPDHCRGGMKFGIDVKQQGANSPPTPVGTPTPPPNTGATIFEPEKRLTVWTRLFLVGILVLL